ncbi:MAG: indolepyruvate ferredoxin oxidoreductase subunit alpha [Deltaproteobacteria bacterium]|nr:indolepyruvate ferredoxin oxidoreductase subunit alpha [Deltaproteobacteria bacterium]
MSTIDLNAPGKELLLMGNEAIARGALEAGVKVCTAYPGTPSTDIIENLASVAKSMGLYVEWSTNEKVALEVASAASFSGLRSICAMKQNGLNVASDYLLSLNLIGIEAGLLLVTCDDPSAHSSSNEQDSRPFAKLADLPLLEPSTFQEAKEMTKWAFALSEEMGIVCLMRGVTRTSHARGNVTLGPLPPSDGRKAWFDKSRQRNTNPIFQKHDQLHRNLIRLEEIFAASPFNQYIGPERPDVLIITCGSGWLYSQEALELLGLEDAVGIFKIGTTWPLPTKIIIEKLAKTEKVLFIEEVDSFLEGNVKELAADFSGQIGPKTFFGKRSQHIPFFGEMNADRVIDALRKIFNMRYQARSPEYEAQAAEVAAKMLPSRALGFCPGCSHRASYWSIKNALQLDNRQGFATYDIGCYALGRGPAGYYLLKTGGAMGTGTGLASGFGKLADFGFAQPVVAMCGDSTFFHAAMPALVNACYNKSSIVMVILDNSATAMTGFQPHPGVGRNAMGEEVAPVEIEAVCRSFGAKVLVTDPFDLDGTKQKMLQALEDPVGAKVVIMRRKCQMLKGKEEKPPYKVRVNPEICIGDDCGCDRLCTRVFKCPGLMWDKKSAKARIDEVICVGCGVCVEICPEKAIIKEEM